MIERRLLLLVSLCFVGGACVTKIVRRRGVSSIHTQHTGNGATDQWDTSLERNDNTMTRIKELIGPEEVEEQIRAHQSHGASPLFTKESFVGFNAKPPVQINKDSDQAHLRVQAPIDDSRDILEFKRGRNNTKKGGRVDKWIPMHHRTTSGIHNRTRFKIPSRSRISSNSAVHTTAGTKVFTPDSPRKLNLTGSLLKLISKENLVRIVNSQLQSVPGLNIPGKMSHSRKRDLINMDHSQVEAFKMKKQDKIGNLELYNLDNLTAELHSSAFRNTSLNPDQTIHTLFRQFSGLTMDLGEGDRKTEVRGAPGTASWKYKHFTTHLASTPQSEIMPVTETNPFAGQSDMGISHTPSQIDWGHRPGAFSSLTERSLDVKRESDQSVRMPFGATQNPLIKISEPIDSSHILKLPPDPEWGRKEVEESREMTVDSRPGRDGRGLVFQEMDEDEDEGRNQQKGEISRSRKRRSWIWNQFFVIEEYAGPEPVLIGRVRTPYDSLKKIVLTKNSCKKNLTPKL